MPFLSLLERRTGRELGSASAIADSKQTLICSYLSTAVLVGLLLNSLFGWSWADPVAGLVVVFALRDGIEAWKGEVLRPTHVGHHRGPGSIRVRHRLLLSRVGTTGSILATGDGSRRNAYVRTAPQANGSYLIDSEGRFTVPVALIPFLSAILLAEHASASLQRSPDPAFAMKGPR